MPRQPEPTFWPLGDAALIVSPGGGEQEGRRRVRRLAAACGSDPLPGVTDVTPAFDLLGVHFDPGAVPHHVGESPGEAVARWLKARLGAGVRCDPAVERVVEIPVCYDGADLAEVSSHAGLHVDEAIARHSGAEYRVGAVGFAPGFAYLEGLPAELHTPRRATPRSRVPAGSVAIGGAYTGVYPWDSPGGWNLIGRTTTTLFDAEAAPPSLLAVGDIVRFRPVGPEGLPAPGPSATPPVRPVPREGGRGRPVLRVVSPGAGATLQGLGRPGRQAYGVSPGGAMDPASCRLANLLAGAPVDGATIEGTLVGPVLEAVVDVTLGVAGALPAATPSPRRLHLRRGERLDLRRLVGGARCYVAAGGGFGSPRGVGSPLKRNDLLSAHDPTPPTGRLVVAPLDGLSRGGEATTLRYLPGPQAALFDPERFRRFNNAVYRITPQSDRMGLRCEGEPIPPRQADQAASQPVAHGAIQAPPSGKPMILGADRQTLGGYPVIGCVITADLPRLGQLRPGDAVAFEEVSPAQAEALRRDLERSLRVVAAGIALHAP